jgi:dihydropyrimidinase
MVEGALPLELPGQLAEAIQAGYPTVKIFTTDITPSRKGRMVDFGDIWEVFQVLKASGGLGVIHSEDNDIVMHMYGKLIREGRTSFTNIAEVHNTLSEDISFRRVIAWPRRSARRSPMMHTSAASGVGDREARARRADYGESLHQHALHVEDYKRPNGQIITPIRG